MKKNLLIIALIVITLSISATVLAQTGAREPATRQDVREEVRAALAGRRSTITRRRTTTTPATLKGEKGDSVKTVQVTTLNPGTAATANFDPATGVLALGIPRGDTGAPGPQSPVSGLITATQAAILIGAFALAGLLISLLFLFFVRVHDVPLIRYLGTYPVVPPVTTTHTFVIPQNNGRTPDNYADNGSFVNTGTIMGDVNMNNCSHGGDEGTLPFHIFDSAIDAVMELGGAREKIRAYEAAAKAAANSTPPADKK